MKRLQRFSSIFGILLLFVGFSFAQQDSSPPLPAKLILKIFNLEKAYDQARDYHNNKFKKKWNSQPREGSFSKNHPLLIDHWITFNDNLDPWIGKLMVDAGGVSVQMETRVKNIETIRLGKEVMLISQRLVKLTEGLTELIYSPEMREIWKEFVKRLEKLENTVQELEGW